MQTTDRYAEALQKRGLTAQEAHRCAAVIWQSERTDLEQELVEACLKLVQCPADKPAPSKSFIAFDPIEGRALGHSGMLDWTAKRFPGREVLGHEIDAGGFTRFYVSSKKPIATSRQKAQRWAQQSPRMEIA